MRPSGSLLWAVMVALLLGLIAMHHAPGHRGHGEGSPVGHAAVVTMGDSDPSDSPVPGGGSSALDELLHLCLAILAAGGTLLATWLALRTWPFATRVARRPWFAATRTARALPPTPVPRRLAALCVLRI